MMPLSAIVQHLVSNGLFELLEASLENSHELEPSRVQDLYELLAECQFVGLALLQTIETEPCEEKHKMDFPSFLEKVSQEMLFDRLDGLLNIDQLRIDKDTLFDGSDVQHHKLPYAFQCPHIIAEFKGAC